MKQVGFVVLGRVGVTIDGEDVPVRGRRERAVLALLLASRRRTVSAERILDELWGGYVGEAAASPLHVAVSRLRALVEPDRPARAPARLLVSTGPGYALLADPEAVDAERFGTLVDRAHAALAAGDAEQTAALCLEAERLWAGTPYGDSVESDTVSAEVARLEDLRIGARELYSDALLRLGRHAIATAELEGLVAAHPFRERLAELYALALYRSGRQADALGALRRVREALVDQLGVDLSPALQQLTADVLAQSPSLELRPVAPAVQTSTVARTPPEQDPLIGRAEASETLQRAFDSVVAGTGTAVVISGEAGIGKTRLVEAFTSGAAAQGARVLWGRCHEADVAPAYWPWVAVLQGLGDAPLPTEVAELVAPSGGRSAGDAGAAALRTYDAVSRVLASQAEVEPLVVVLEDLHWADTSSLRLLAFAAEALRRARVLLVVTVRSSEAGGVALQTCLAALARQFAVRVPLRGLDVVDVERLADRVSGGHVDQDLATVLADRTDGNPFFVIELMRLLVAQQRLDAAGAREVEVPDGVQDVLRLRLARLPEQVRRVLTVAAVVGREFDLDVVAEVAGGDPDQVLDGLEEAVRAHAIEEERTPTRYRFTHALVRETLAGDLSSLRRGRVHAAIAQALEPRLADDPDSVSDVAHHFALGAAVQPELAASAVRFASAAAVRAQDRGALDEALLHWEQAVAADSAAPTTDRRRRYDALLGLGRARWRSGQVLAARAAIDEAMELADGDVALVAEAATSFLGNGLWHWREFGDSDQAMVEVLSRCIAELPPGELRVRTLASLSMELIYQWRSAEADEVSRQSVEEARSSARPELLVDIAALRMLALMGLPGCAPERLALADEVLALPLTLEQELTVRFHATLVRQNLGDQQEADRQMLRCGELARRLRHSAADVPLAWWRFCRAVVTGEPPQLLQSLAQEAMQLHERSGMIARNEGAAIAALTLTPLTEPLPDAVVTHGSAHPNPNVRATVAAGLAARGQVEQALQALGDPLPDGAWDFAYASGECHRVEVLAQGGPSEALARSLARVESWAEEYVLLGSTLVLGSAWYFVGLGREGMGDVEGARAAYATSIERNSSAGYVIWVRAAEARLEALS